MLKLAEKTKEAEKLFDQVCFRYYMAGKMNRELPVDEARDVWKEIKKLLTKS